jgi:hypothetical protein
MVPPAPLPPATLFDFLVAYPPTNKIATPLNLKHNKKNDHLFPLIIYFWEGLQGIETVYIKERQGWEPIHDKDKANKSTKNTCHERT